MNMTWNCAGFGNMKLHLNHFKIVEISKFKTDIFNIYATRVERYRQQSCNCHTTGSKVVDHHQTLKSIGPRIDSRGTQI